MSDKITVVLVDDHPLFREGVAHTLRSAGDFDVVAEGATADDALLLAADLMPDLVLLDIGIPGSGLRAAETIMLNYPVIKVVMFTASEEEDDVVAALRAGARGYVLKGVPARELVRILRAVCGGEGYVPPALAVGLLSEMTGSGRDTRQHADPLNLLTEREQQILEGVAAGLSNKEVGLKLALSEKTVKHYMTNVLHKLQVRNRVEAALLARKLDK